MLKGVETAEGRGGYFNQTMLFGCIDVSDQKVQVILVEGKCNAKALVIDLNESQAVSELHFRDANDG